MAKEGINEKIFKALKLSEKSNIPVLILSNPGMGKTTTVNLYAKLRNMEVISLRGNSQTAETVLGYDCSPSEVTEGKTQAALHLRPSWFDQLMKAHEQGKRTLLFLDEITTAHESVQAALLHLIFERTVHDEKLPDDTIICSAGNYSANLSTSMTMLAPSMNRFCIINIIPDVTIDLSSFLCKYNYNSKGSTFMQDLEKKLAKLDESEWKEIPDNTLKMVGSKFEESIDQLVRELYKEGILDLRVSELNDVYSDNVSNDSRVYGFPTFRSLSYLVDAAVYTYFCFGENGINSAFFQDVCDGLCGVGLSTKKISGSQDTEVVKTYIGDRFFNRCVKTLEFLNNMNNDTLNVLSTDISNILKNKPKTFTTNDYALINLILNKVKELNNNKDTKDSKKPLGKDLMIDIFDLINKSGNVLMKDDKNGSNNSSIETLASKVTLWNTLAELFNTMGEFLNNRSYVPTEDPEIYKKAKLALINCTNEFTKLKNYIKIAQTKNAAEASLVPEAKQLTIQL